MCGQRTHVGVACAIDRARLPRSAPRARPESDNFRGVKNIALFALAAAGLLGCGDVLVHQRNDAAVSQDGKTADAGPDAIGMGMVNVITQAYVPYNGLSTGSAVPNIVVVGTNVDESFGAMTTSDTNGSASLAVEDGGAVTAIYPGSASSNQVYIETYAGVKAGDTLTYGQYVYPNENLLGTLTVNYPAFAGASSYDIFTPCGGYGVGNVLTYPTSVYGYCGVPPLDVQVIAFNGSGSAIGYSNGSAASFTAPQTLTMPALTAIPTMTVTATDIPDIVTQASARVGSFTGYQQELFSIESNGAPTGNAYSLTGKLPPPTGHQIGSLWLSRNNGNIGNTFIYDAVTSSTAWNIDTPVLTPWVTATLAPAASNEMLWFAESTPNATRADVAVMELYWSHTDTTVTPNVTTNYDWTIFLPPDVTTLQFPSFPAAAGMVLPGSTDYIYFNNGTMLIQVPSLTNGYDGIRALPERDLKCPECAVITGDVTRIITNQVEEDD